MLLPFDTHVHTCYSPCARDLDGAGQPLASPERYLSRATELGLRAIVFTDHCVEDPSAPGAVPFYESSGLGVISALRGELAGFLLTDLCQVYLGCETETMSTEWVGITPRAAANLDFVLVPTTHYHLPGVPQPASFAPADVAEHMLIMLASVVSKGWLDSVAHPFCEAESLIGDLRRIYDALDKAWLTDILGFAAHNGVALEVNGSSVTSVYEPHYALVYREIVQLAKSLGVRFTFGSDAHDARNLGLTPEAETWIISAGLTMQDFLTPAQLQAKRGGM